MPALAYLSPAAAQFHSRDLQTDNPNEPILINSRPYMRATGNAIGFQSRPQQVVPTTGYVIGGEVIPRVASGIAAGGVIGFHASAYLQGDTGNIAGDMRALQAELITDITGNRTIAGHMTCLRCRSNITAAAVTGMISAIRVEIAESLAWDCVLELTGDYGANGIWDCTDVNVAGTKRGAFKVVVGGQDRWVRLYDSGI
jgi:hypothetical protein